MTTIRILILEDDLKTLSVITDSLFVLEEGYAKDKKGVDIAVTIFSEYTQVLDYVNKLPDSNFDIILLDRDCKLGGSFHCIDFKNFALSKFVAISTNPEYNDTAIKNGVKKQIAKNYDLLIYLSKELSKLISEQIESILNGDTEPSISIKLFNPETKLIEEDYRDVSFKDDEKFEAAVKLTKNMTSISTLALQKCLKIGYARALSLIKILQKEHLISEERDCNDCYLVINRP